VKRKAYYRGRDIPVPVIEREFSVQEVKEWREIEYHAGRPSTLQDFYRAHRLCPDCGGIGVIHEGWSPPKGDAEIARAAELSVSELPFYEPCPRCAGDGLTRPHPGA